MHIFPRPAETAVKRLLAAAQLPTADLEGVHAVQFFGCGPEEAPDGVIGMEVHGRVALLRSLAVEPRRRRGGCGTALVAHVEQEARRRGVASIYLLTTTAEAFFERRGYARIPRAQAPGAIRDTREFADICPATAAFMVKHFDQHEDD